MTDWIVCPTLNNLHLTQQAVKSFLAQDIGDVGVLILDTGSTDGTAEWAASKVQAHWKKGPPYFSYVLVPDASVAQCWNTGITIGFGYRTHPHDQVLVCNNDVELHPATYRLLVEDGGGFVTGVGVTPEQFHDRMKLSTTQNSNPFLGEVHAFGDEPFKNLHATRRPHPDFSCFLIRRWVWEKVGPFDEAYKVGYVEDADYHLRMHRLGVGAYCIDVPFLHHASGTIKGASDEQAQRIMRQADKNRELFRSRHGCIPGSPEYTDLFRPETFGVDAHVAPVAEPD